MREICEQMVRDLDAGIVPHATAEDFPCFSTGRLAGNPNISPESLQQVLASLSKADIPTLRRALDAITSDEPAWLGFKIVTDSEAALVSEDTDVVGMRGRGSADGMCGVFFCNAAGDIVFSRSMSERDRFQMQDITRGPGMHDEQFAGVSWLAEPLFATGRVFIIGAGNVGADLARICDIVGFSTIACDDDPEYLNAERFPLSKRVLCGFDAMAGALDAGPEDYICVLTRGHAHDPEGVEYGMACGARYVGMMGCAEKNARVMELVGRHGHDISSLDGILHAPIGLEFGAKSSAELALCIAAQLVQIRTQRRGLAATHS